MDGLRGIKTLSPNDFNCMIHNKLTLVLLSLFFMAGCNFDKKSVPNSEIISNEIIMNNLAESFVNDDGTVHYPDYFCGSYVDSIRGIIIYCKENTVMIRRDLENRCKSSFFVIEKRSYSKNELLDIMRILTNRLSETNLNKELGFVMSYIMEKENKISIVLEDTTRMNIKRFKTLIMDSPFFLYQIGKMDFEEEPCL